MTSVQVGAYAFVYALPVVKILACAVSFPGFISFNSLGTFLHEEEEELLGLV